MNRFFTFFVIVLVVLACTPEKKYNQEIALPFSNVSVPINQFEVNANEEKVIRFQNGTSLSIPKNAFVDKNGNLIKGKVNLEFREFNKAADIIASGIPMVYEDENGEQKQMESAGMFEIRGKVNNEDIYIANDKSIQVNTASQVSGEYDFYYLEEERKKEVASAGLFVSEANAQSQNNNGSTKKVRWQKLTNNADRSEDKVAEEKNPNVQHFNLQFDTVKYPETKYLKDIQFEIASNDPEMNSLIKENNWVLKEKWEQLEISKVDKMPDLLESIPLEIENGWEAFYNGTKLPDSSGILLRKGGLSLYDFKGEKIKSYGDSTVGWFEVSPDSKRILAFYENRDNHLDAWDRSFSLYSIEGKLLKTFASTNGAYYLNNGDRIILNEYKKSYSQGDMVSCLIVDQNGSLIKKIQTEAIFSAYGIENQFIVSDDKKNVLVIPKGSIDVLDHNGRLINSFQLKHEYSHIGFLNYKNAVIIVDKNGKVKVWDWQNNKSYTADQSLEKNYEYDYKLFNSHSTKPEIILTKDEEKGFFIWNWDTNKVTKVITSGQTHAYYSENFIYGDIYEESKGHMKCIWNDKGEPMIGISQYTHAFLDSNSNSLLINYDGKVICKNLNGELIKDFSNYDSSIFRGVRGYDNSILTISKDGLVSNWSDKGVLRGSFKTVPSQKYLQGINKDYIVTYGKDRIARIWDTNGNFVSMFKGYYIDPSKDNKNFVTYSNRFVRFWKFPEDTSRKENLYQILTAKGDTDFVAYVKLDKKDLVKINEYKRIKEEKIAAEDKREEKEVAVLRSFAINKFGIYNWDRFYKDENSIQLTADFDFGNDVNAYNKITVFLICGNDQNVVIKYPKSAWDKFSFDPAANPQMIAVLPDDKIAVFNNFDFKNLPIKEIKKSKKYTFKMKILDKVNSVNQLNQLLIKPS